MITYLLTWNPKYGAEIKFDKWLKNIQKKGFHKENWSCGRNKKIKFGDRIFLLKQGKEPKGLIASGWSVSEVYEDRHWLYENSTALYVDVEFDTIFNPEEKIFKYDWLKRGKLKKMFWDTQVSGIKIPDDVAKILEEEWEKFTGKKIIAKNLTYPDDSQELLIEGKHKTINVKIYERNPIARDRCLKIYGFNCFVCGFNFEKFYGKIGKEYIHVHHILPISKIRKEYKLNPKKDLRPICPNCHAMLHRKNPPYSINELKKILESNKNKLKS